MALQSLRSQGYNDVHEYISRYRVAKLRDLIISGEITDLKQVDMVGFRSVKTATTSFERYENKNLSEFLAKHKNGSDESADEVVDDEAAQG